MKIIIPRLIFSVGILAAALCFGLPVSPAGAYGNEKWCTVIDSGGDNVSWNCDFETYEECMSSITAGSRGYCALNSTWRPPSPQH
jgi:Protein of unknown function (DUF3551)